MIKLARRALLFVSIVLTLLCLAHWIAVWSGYRPAWLVQRVTHPRGDVQRVLTLRIDGAVIGIRAMTIRNPGLLLPPATTPGWYDHDTLPWGWRQWRKVYSAGWESRAQVCFDRFAVRNYRFVEVGFDAWSACWR